MDLGSAPNTPAGADKSVGRPSHTFKDWLQLLLGPEEGYLTQSHDKLAAVDRIRSVWVAIVQLSFPKIISARIYDASRTRLAW